MSTVGGAFSRRKGVRAERELVRLLREHGFEAVRVPLSGAAEGFKGDIETPILPGPVEVKVGKHVPATCYRWLLNRRTLLMRRDRAEWLVVMRLEDFLALLSTEGQKSEEAK